MITSQNVKVTSWLKRTAILDQLHQLIFHRYIALEETKLRNTIFLFTLILDCIRHKFCSFERKLESSQLWDLPLSLTWATLGNDLVNNSKYKEMRYKPWCPVTVFLDQVYWEYHGWSRSPEHSFLFLLPVPKNYTNILSIRVWRRSQLIITGFLFANAKVASITAMIRFI